MDFSVCYFNIKTTETITSKLRNNYFQVKKLEEKKLISHRSCKLGYIATQSCHMCHEVCEVCVMKFESCVCSWRWVLSSKFLTPKFQSSRMEFQPAVQGCTDSFQKVFRCFPCIQILELSWVHIIHFWLAVHNFIKVI